MQEQSDEFPEVQEWLERARSETLLKGGRRRYDLLEYLVREELEGRGDHLKAYAIALDVLGRGPDFDPTTDSIVRVEVARLRDALELYYARSSDPNEPKIAIPKGSYRPTVDIPAHTNGAVVAKPRHARRRMRYIAVTVFAAVCLSLFSGIRPGSKVRQSDQPIVEIAPIAYAQPSPGHNFALGFRQQLMADLAHLPTVVVRDGPIANDTLRSRAAAAPDYRLDITPAIEGQSGIIGLQLTSMSTATVIWSRTIPVAEGASDFYTNLTKAVRGIGQEVAGPSGAITAEQAALALESLSNSTSISDDYQCLIVSLAFDATKDPRAQQLSRSCLSDAISRGTGNSTLLSAHALNLFFASSEKRGDEEQALLERAKSFASKAVRLNPSDSFAHEVLGNVLSALGDRSGAIERYRRAVELAPSRPAPHFLLGWQMALKGDWDNGVIEMQGGIDMQPNVPGYMIIPLALDAFRRSDYELSLQRAQTIIDRGDSRGYSLAFAASVALEDKKMAERFFTHPDARTSIDPSDPMREVRVTFSNPDVMPKYQEVIEPYLNQINR
ncbi:MAG: hypothetical protein AAF665_12035 [Pseudomonadota bacterium]